MAQWPTSVATDANLYVPANNFQTTLNGAIDNVTTTVVLASVTGLSTNGGYVTIGTEALKFTGISGQTLTGVVRGADNTTAAAHSNGVAVFQFFVADHHNVLKNEIEAIESDLSITLLSQRTATISGNTTWSTARRIESGQLITINNAIVLTVNAPLFAGPYQIFTGAGTVTFGSGFQGTVYPEWWGAAGDGVTNDTAAFNAAAAALAKGGIIQLRATKYLLSTSVTVSNHCVTIQGTAVGLSPYDSGGGLVGGTQILGANGVDCIIANAVDYFTIRDVDISIAVGATSACRAVKLTSSFLPKVLNCRTTNFSTGVYMNNCTDVYVDGCYLSSTNSTVNPVVGMNIDGSSHQQNASVYVSRTISAASGFTGSFYGFWLHGNRIADTFFNQVETDGATYGFYIDGSAVLDSGFSGDIHISSFAADNNVTYGVYVESLTTDSALNVKDGWVSAGTTGCYIHASTGINVTNMQVWTPSTNGIYFAASKNCLATGNVVLYAPTNGIVLDTSPSCIINGNMLIQKAAGTGTAINVFNTSDHSSIIGNVANGISSSYTNGIVTQAGSDYCAIIGNVMPATVITTPYSLNLGSNTHSVASNV